MDSRKHACRPLVVIACSFPTLQTPLDTILPHGDHGRLFCCASKMTQTRQKKNAPGLDPWRSSRH